VSADNLILGVIAFIGALIFGITGFGSALVTIPLATHLVPLKFALALFALVDLACAVSVGLENPRNAVRSEWVRMVPMILVGTALGVTLLVNLPRAAGMLLLGAFVFSYALYSLLRRSTVRVVHPRWGWIAGLCGGITSTLFGAGGPPYAIYLSQRGLTKEQFRAAWPAVLRGTGLGSILGVLPGGGAMLSSFASYTIAALLGLYVARKLFTRISRDALFRVVACILLASGGSLVLRALH